MADNVVKDKLASAKRLADVNESDYVAIFYVGGHGPVLDLATDPVNIKLASEFYKNNKIVSAVCHGPASVFLSEFSEFHMHVSDTCVLVHS